MPVTGIIAKGEKGFFCLLIEIIHSLLNSILDIPQDDKISE